MYEQSIHCGILAQDYLQEECSLDWYIRARDKECIVEVGTCVQGLSQRVVLTDRSHSDYILTRAAFAGDLQTYQYHSWGLFWERDLSSTGRTQIYHDRRNFE